MQTGKGSTTNEKRTRKKLENAMKPRDHRPRSRINLFHGVIAIFSVAALSLDQSFVLAQQAQSQVMTKTGPAPEEAPDDPERPVGFTRCADCSLSRSVAGSDPGRFDLSAGTHPASAVDGEEQEFKGQGAGRRRGKAKLGSECAGHGRVSRRSATHGGKHPVDDGFGERLSGPTIRRNGCNSTHARESPGHRKSKNQRATSRGKQNG